VHMSVQDRLRWRMMITGVLREHGVKLPDSFRQQG